MSDGCPDWVATDIGDPTDFFVGLMKERTPEKAKSLQGAINRHNITFHTNVDEERCYFTAHSTTGRITVGLRGAARLMGHSFSYSCAHYGLLRMLQAETSGRPEPQRYADRMECASQLLQWAIAGDIKSKGATIKQCGLPASPPVHLLRAFDECVPPAQLDVASELYANALVWILYHELSHIQMGHSACKGIESIQQEKDADHSAAAWMLNDATDDTSTLWKRRIGIATALGWLTASAVYFGTGASTTHPAAYNRLYQVLERVLATDDDDTWLFVQVILTLHLINREIDFDQTRIVPDFKENVNYLIDIIAKLRK